MFQFIFILLAIFLGQYIHVYLKWQEYKNNGIMDPEDDFVFLLKAELPNFLARSVIFLGLAGALAFSELGLKIKELFGTWQWFLFVYMGYSGDSIFRHFLKIGERMMQKIGPEQSGFLLFPKVKILPWKEDKWLSRNGNILPWDKAEHFIRDFVIFVFVAGVLTQIFGSVVKLAIWAYTLALILSYIGTTVFQIVYEIKDGLVPYDGVHVEGFSWKDIIAGQLGILLGILLFLRVMI